MDGSNTYTVSDGSVVFQGRTYRLYNGPKLKGDRMVVDRKSELYPDQLRNIPHPPKELYIIGNPRCVTDGLAVIGARKATPYGRACARRFSELAAMKGVTVISGGAYGCDSEAHRGCLDVGGKTVVVLGGGCDQIYPANHYTLFQEVVDSGGAVVSERPWDHPALPFTFRQRNRIIAGCAKAVLIVEAGLPSGTFSTADEALSAGRDVLVVPSAITSPTSTGANRLLYQGATPIVDDETFEDVLSGLFGCLRQESYAESDGLERSDDPLAEALFAEPMRMDRILEVVSVPKRIAHDGEKWIKTHLVELEADGVVARYPDGRYGPAHL